MFLCECGSRSYAGNASLCSARPRPEKPTTLFKEMAVGGPLANAPALRSSVCSAPSAPSFLLKNDNYFPLWKKRFVSVPAGRRERIASYSNTGPDSLAEPPALHSGC